MSHARTRSLMVRAPAAGNDFTLPQLARERARFEDLEPCLNFLFTCTRRVAEGSC